jgi:hypothetical protein
MRLNQTTQPWGLRINSFRGGVSTLLDDARIKNNQAIEVTNLMQVQDGAWKVRWGTEHYGQAISGETKILGIAEYLTTAGARELIAVGGTTGKIFKSVDGGAWSQIGSLTISTSAPVDFLQTNNLLYIANGTDNLVRYNGSTLIQYTGLSAPSLTSVTRGSGLSAGAFTYFYKVTALNEVGETVGSNEISTTVNVARELWTPTTQYIDVTWGSVVGATRYQIYIAEEAGKNILLTDTINTTYRDDGSINPNTYVLVPQDNTTTAPKFSEMSLVGNRMWGTKDTVNKYRVYWSSAVDTGVAFSAYYGGGWVDINPGGRELPVWVGSYRTGKGDNATTVLCSSPEGVGAVWQIALDTLTVADVTGVVPVVQQVVGTIGTESPKAVVTAMDSLVFANKRAVYNLGNKQQIFNVLATDEMSVNIRPSYRDLDLTKLSNMCAYWYDGKIFYSATEKGATDNSMIFIYDIERQNWTWKWTIGVTQFLEYTDSTKTSHFIGIKPNTNRLIKFNPNVLSDLGQAFRTSYTSGLIAVADNVKIFAKTKDIILELGRPRGTISFEVLGLLKKQGFSSLAGRSITDLDTISNVNFVDALFGDVFLSENPNTSTTFTQASIKKRLKIRKLINAIQFKVYSNSVDVDYTILSIQADGNLIPTRIPAEWKN